MNVRARDAVQHLGVREETDFFDYRALGNYIGFALRSVKRHPFLALLSVVLVVGLSVAAMKVLPKTYRVETVIQALRNPSLPTLANAGLYRPYEADAPTRAARETVLRRDNLLALIEQTDLEARRERSRAPAVVLKDLLAAKVRGRELTAEERQENLVARLEKALRVDVTEGTVTITVDWPEATAAFDLVQAASKNFLETRHATEIAMVRDALAILEGHAKTEKVKLDAALDQLQVDERAAAQRYFNSRRGADARAQRAATPPAAATRRTDSDMELARLDATLASKRQAINELEEFRRRRLNELQAQLLQYQAMYADKHPAIVSLKQNIEMLSLPSPQLDALAADVKELEREIQSHGGEVPVQVPAQVAGTAPAPLRDDFDERLPDPRAEYARNRVRLMFQNYAGILDRIDAARVEMDAAQAAFKYRYGVISPPQLPKRPLKPTPVRVIGGSVLGGLLLGLLVCVAKDLRSQALLERWQVEHALGVPLISGGGER
jgi:uncharacterized protein involved in exopolysaccharide biosynthesis